MQINQRKPRLIPVLDVMNGQVVRARGGQRNQYKPFTSSLTQSTDPAMVASVLLDASGAKELYIADLDAIAGCHETRTGGLSSHILELLDSCSAPVWLDAGFGPGLDIPNLLTLPRLRPVIGFETCGAPDYLLNLLTRKDPSNLAFSIDMRASALIGDWRSWGLENERDAFGLAQKVIRMGCRHLVVLDLARVGSGSGCGTEDLVRAIRDEFPQIELIAGGGVKSWEDVERLGECGADAVLVASALHDGTITVPRPISPGPHQ
jgi:phosphoribosylformimino-5-aminoimidazole carboxamide ribotide isomerase